MISNITNNLGSPCGFDQLDASGQSNRVGNISNQQGIEVDQLGTTGLNITSMSVDNTGGPCTNNVNQGHIITNIKRDQISNRADRDSEVTTNNQNQDSP